MLPTSTRTYATPYATCVQNFPPNTFARSTNNAATRNKYILDGLNAERALIAAECIGDGYWFIDTVTKYANERIVFDRPIGKNQGVQFPIAKAYVNVEAASLMRFKACALFDAHQACGAQANMAKMLAADASWEAANVCLQFHGGFSFACEYDVERKFRETRLY